MNCKPNRWLAVAVLFLLSQSANAAASSVAASDSSNHGVILLYHHISTETPAITSISPQYFKQQIRYLADNDFRIWPLPKLVEALKRGETIPDKVVAITFDDNYQSVYHVAFPILKDRQWPFTVFVSTDSVDQKINLQANWDQVREMADYGATIANHSASHAHLLQRLSGETTHQWQQRVRQDIQKARRRIREETGQDHLIFAYPYGEFNSALAEIVEELGYTGIGQQSGPAGHGLYHNNASLALPRFPFAGDYSKLDDFALKVLTLPLPVAAATGEESPLTFRQTKPQLHLELAPGDYRTEALQCYGSGQGKLAIAWDGKFTLTITPKQAIPVGRSRYNCTMPTGLKNNGVTRYYWFSHPWIRFTESGGLID